MQVELKAKPTYLGRNVPQLLYINITMLLYEELHHQCSEFWPENLHIIN
jgi:hypothetical protein